MTPAVRRAVFSLVYYLLVVIFYYWLDIVSPNGPCGPGMGAVLIFFQIMLFGPVLIIYHFIRCYKGDKTYQLSRLVHAGVEAACILWLAILV